MASKRRGGMSENYNLPDKLGGLILPAVEGLISLGKTRGMTKEKLSLAKRLGDFLDLREIALSIKPYQEFHFGEIARVSYELLEEPLLDETNPYTGLSLEEKAQVMLQKRIEQYQAGRGVEIEAKNFYKTIVETITIKGLDYLSTFHYLLDGIEFVTEDLLEAFPILKRPFALGYRKLKEKYGDPVQDYHIVPEVIDWNFYLTIRGKEPKELVSPYDKVLERVFILAQLREAEEKAKKYLDENPNAVEEIMKGNPPVEDPNLPRGKEEVRAIYREAYRRTHGKEECPEIDLDKVEVDGKI